LHSRLEDVIRQRAGEEKAERRHRRLQHVLNREYATLNIRRDFYLPNGTVAADNVRNKRRRDQCRKRPCWHSASNREQKLTPDEARAKERLANIYSAAKLEPPKLDDVLSGEAKLGRPKARQVFQMLIDSGIVTKVTEEFYFASDSIKDLRTRLSKFATTSADKTIDVAKFKELACVTRKFAINLRSSVAHTRLAAQRRHRRKSAPSGVPNIAGPAGRPS
jgi:hypothetical protein